MEWQDISTAPQETGRQFLVFEPGSRIGDMQEEPDIIRIAARKRADAIVRQDDDKVHVRATHWMPLPPPPAAK